MGVKFQVPGLVLIVFGWFWGAQISDPWGDLK